MPVSDRVSINRICDARELAQLLGMNERVIRNKARNGSFPPPLNLAGRLLRWDVEDVMRWVRSREGVLQT